MYVYPVYSFSDEKCKKIQCKKTIILNVQNLQLKSEKGQIKIEIRLTRY